MHPAPSIILFTTLTGAGYGLLFVLGLGAPLGLLPAARAFGLIALALALGLITLGLLFSTFHLGHPERAWRALSQWRSSWLSREGMAAVVTYLPALLFLLGWLIAAQPGGVAILFGPLAALGALVTVACTGMIYASLKPIRAWFQPLVVPVYLAMALLTGALLAQLVLALFGAPRIWAGVLTLAAAALALALKTLYWRAIDSAGERPSPESATGLGSIGIVRMVDPPHTQTNYLLDEMGFQVGRRHARKLRRWVYGLGLLGVGLATLLALATSGFLAILLAALAAAAGLVGASIERWLFFAEATHTVTLYYGRRPD